MAVALEEIVGASLHMLEPLLSQHPIVVELPPEQILVNCDGSLLERCSPTCWKTPINTRRRRGHHPGIRARTLPEWLEVEVWDNGPGIPADQLQLIFDKFFTRQ
ncbi:ATP-binding protein [Serratia ureilytica]